jgi:hypothetical protein
VLDPSAAFFANSVIFYGISVLAFYGISIENNLQDSLLASGAILGFSISGVLAALEGGLGPVKDYMPAFITASLVGSVLISLILRKFRNFDTFGN